MRTMTWLLACLAGLLMAGSQLAFSQEPATEETPPAEATPTEEATPAGQPPAEEAPATSEPAAEEPAPETEELSQPAQEKEKPSIEDDGVYQTHVGLFTVFGHQRLKVQTPQRKVITSKFPILDVVEHNGQIYIVNSVGFLRYNEELDLKENPDPEELKLLAQEEYRAPLKCIFYYPFTWQGRKYFPVYYLPPKAEGQEGPRRRVFRGLVRVVEKPDRVTMVYLQYPEDLPEDSSWTISRWKPTAEHLTFAIVKDFRRHGPFNRRVRFTFEEEVFEDLPTEE